MRNEILGRTLQKSYRFPIIFETFRKTGVFISAEFLIVITRDNKVAETSVSPCQCNTSRFHDEDVNLRVKRGEVRTQQRPLLIHALLRVKARGIRRQIIVTR